MNTMHRCITILTVLFLLTSPTALLAANEPAWIYGTYENVVKYWTYCNPKDTSETCHCANGKASTDGVCDHQDVNRLEISKTQERWRPVSVKLSFIGGNGHMCEYEGIGSWMPEQERVTVFSEFVETDYESCSITVIFNSRRKIQVVTRDRECQNYCGVRASMDGAILKKKK
jgi:hypothetical protein